jgi:type II secretory pathway pseudopilin PulG
MKRTNERKAFSLLVAIIIILLMSSVAMFVMNISAKVTRETTAQYQREQAMLYAKSYTEYAIMAVMANNRALNCLSNINATIGAPNNGTGYLIEVRIAYIGNAAEIGTCATERQLSAVVVTPGSPLNIIVDTYVRYKEPDHPDPANAPFITYHKRTLQKI